MKTFQFMADPSHGWLKVPVTELERLGIQDDISKYSYERNGMAYLEEDLDMGLFLKARLERNEPVKIKESFSNKQSRIRGYRMYRGDIMVERTNFMTGKKFMERRDTPYSCSPSNETYWSA